MRAATDGMRDILGCIAADGSSVTHVSLREEDSSASLKKVIISNLTPGMLVFLPDKGSTITHKGKKIDVCMSPLLSKKPGTHHNKACDAVVFFEMSVGQAKVLFIELKSGSFSRSTEQFQSTSCFVRYVLEILFQFYGICIEIQSEHYVICCERTLPIPKRVTRPPISNYGRSAKNPVIRQVKNGQELPVGWLFG